VLALGWSALRGSPDGRLLVRLLAAVALTRRLCTMDAEFAVFALAACGAALAARLRIPLTRTRLAWLAVGLLALRTALFHAMGFIEDDSTFDVGQAFAGLGATEARLVDAVGGTRMSWQNLVATVLTALRMALPWILFLAPLARARQRTPGAAPAALACVAMDLALCFVARGAVIVAAAWAWRKNAWWFDIAKTVFAFGLADTVLLLLCTLVVGVWWRRADGVEATGPARAASAA
jgi:hypothetical protein